MGLLDFLFGGNDKKIKGYLNKGAILLDVRTVREFNANSLPKSQNIPLQELHHHVEELKQMNKPFIVYCESGVRSAKAAKFLNLNNIDAINGGGWRRVQSILAK
jgi:rhodanese-related sulfurtransferase